MDSLHARFSLWLLIVLFALFGLVWIMTSHAPQQLTERYATSRLEHDGESLIAGLHKNRNGNWAVRERYIEPIYLRPYSGHYYVVETPGQRLDSRSLWDYRLQLPALPAGSGHQILHLKGPIHQPLLVWRRHIEVGGTPIVISVAEDMSALNRDVAVFRKRFALTLAGILFALVVLQHFVVRYLLRPLTRMQHELDELEAGTREALGEQLPSEVRPLVHRLNNLLGNLRRSLERSRAAAGNLAHRLKTPLSRLQQISDDKQAAVVHKELDAIVTEMRGSIDRELRRARMAGGFRAGTRIDLHTELSRLVEVMGKLYRERGLDIELRMRPGQTVTLDREDLLELFGNLLDNACKWAASKVRISVTEQAGLNVVVEDDGPGADLDALEGLTERGKRVDEAVPGYGLGLAIVRDLVREYGGQLHFGASPELKGLRVEIELPPV
ncbi:MAG: ATP-binding protein [Gammaproteobacteria bacterium]|jgi:signal transduction histidine kinase